MSKFLLLISLFLCTNALAQNNRISKTIQVSATVLKVCKLYTEDNNLINDCNDSDKRIINTSANKNTTISKGNIKLMPSIFEYKDGKKIEIRQMSIEY